MTLDPWPWILFAALLTLALGLRWASHRWGTEHVDHWVFAHRDRLPIPFLLIGIVSRLLSKGPRSPAQWRSGLALLGLLLIVVGESLRIWAVGIAGAATRSRSTNARRLVQEGPYTIVRNPIYVGNLLLCLGLACFTASWTVALACLLYFLIVYSRIIRTEEHFLRATFGTVYEAFCRRVPQFLPRFRWSWQVLRAPFSMRELRKEYQTIAGIICATLVLHLVVLQSWQGSLSPHSGDSSLDLASTRLETPTRVTTITLEQALQRGGTTQTPMARAPGPSRHDASRPSVSSQAVAHPGGPHGMITWLKRQLPGVVSGALAFAGTYFASCPEESCGEEFEEQFPTIASTTLIALAVHSLVSQTTNPSTALDSLRPSRPWTVSPYAQVDREDERVGVLVRVQF